jgi:hypothetical protein
MMMDNKVRRTYMRMLTLGFSRLREVAKVKGSMARWGAVRS